MSENAELWSRPDKQSQYTTITAWLRNHQIDFNENDNLENLIQLYRDVECGKVK